MDWPLPTSSKLQWDGGSGAGNDAIRGKSLRTNSTANVMGTIVELIPATEYNSSEIMLSLMLFIGQSPDAEILLDILIGPIGSEEILVGGLHWHSDSDEASAVPINFRIPIDVPQGSRISVRAQSSITGSQYGWHVNLNLAIGTFGIPSGKQHAVTYGADYASTSSTITLSPPGGDVYTAWTEITADSDGFRGFLVSVGANGTGFNSGGGTMQIGLGGIGSEVAIANGLAYLFTSSENVYSDLLFYPVKIPLGQRISIRAKSTIAFPIGICFHGVR